MDAGLAGSGYTILGGGVVVQGYSDTQRQIGEVGKNGGTKGGGRVEPQPSLGYTRLLGDSVATEHAVWTERAARSRGGIKLNNEGRRLVFCTLTSATSSSAEIESRFQAASAEQGGALAPRGPCEQCVT